MAEYTVTRNERLKDKEINFDFEGISKLVFDGTTATAELTEDQVEYLRTHGYHVEEVVEEVVDGEGGSGEE